MTDQLNTIFDNFGIWLLSYRIKFSFLYIKQGHFLHNYFVAMKYNFFFIWAKGNL